MFNVIKTAWTDNLWTDKRSCDFSTEAEARVLHRKRNYLWRKKCEKITSSFRILIHFFKVVYFAACKLSWNSVWSKVWKWKRPRTQAAMDRWQNDISIEMGLFWIQTKFKIDFSTSCIQTFANNLGWPLQHRLSSSDLNCWFLQSSFAVLQNEVYQSCFDFCTQLDSSRWLVVRSWFNIRPGGIIKRVYTCTLPSAESLDRKHSS